MSKIKHTCDACGTSIIYSRGWVGRTCIAAGCNGMMRMSGSSSAATKDADHSAEPVDSPTTAAPWSFTAQDEADTSMEEGDIGGPVIAPPGKPTYHKAMDYVRIMGGRK